jgi:hypothetical protein
MTDAEIARRVEDQARDAAQGAATAASDAEEALGEVIAEASELRKEDYERRGLVRRRATRAGWAAAASQGDRRSRPVHQDRVRRCREDHRRPCRQGHRADEQVRKLVAVS